MKDVPARNWMGAGKGEKRPPPCEATRHPSIHRRYWASNYRAICTTHFGPSHTLWGLDRGSGVSSSCHRLRNSFARASLAQPRTPKVGKDGANALEGAQAKVADPHRG